MGIQSAINLGCACFLFPQTVSHKYIRSLATVLALIRDGIGKQDHLLSISPINLEQWREYKVIQEKVQKGKATFIAMIPMEQFLEKEISYCRIGGSQLVDLKGRVRKLLSGLGEFVLFNLLSEGGFHYWYYQIESKITVHLQSRPNTPASTPRGSTISLDVNDSYGQPSPSHSGSHLHLPQFAALNRRYEPVGVLESHTYSDLEAGFQATLNEKPTHYEDMVLHLSCACSDLLNQCESGMDLVIQWFECVNSDRFYGRLYGARAKAARRRELTVQIEKTLESLQKEIDRFQDLKRLDVLEPHLNWFRDPHCRRQPSYRLLFTSFFYEFHINEFAESLNSLITELHRIDNSQQLPKLWLPDFLEVSKWIARGGEQKEKAGHEDLAGEDQDPEEIPHITDPDKETPLQVQKRNPDAGPPTNIGHLIGRELVRCYHLLGRQDIFFAIKAGILTVLVAMPSYFPMTAGWFYLNRGIWAVIMAALTVAQFTADTIFGFVVRVIGTFLGALLGMIVWYTGSGSGTGNPYGLLAVLAVVLPFVLFIRINFVLHRSWVYSANPRSTSHLCRRSFSVSPLPSLWDIVGKTYI